MPDDTRRRRTVLAALGAIAALIGVGLAIALGGGEDGAGEEPVIEVQTGTEPTGSATGRGDHGETAEETAPAPPPPERFETADQRDVEDIVIRLVQANELGDGVAFCRLVGEDPGQADGIEALEACARLAGIDAVRLPSSDELSLDAIEVHGERATARLQGGGALRLERRGGRWVVRAFDPGF